MLGPKGQYRVTLSHRVIGMAVNERRRSEMANRQINKFLHESSTFKMNYFSLKIQAYNLSRNEGDTNASVAGDANKH